MSERGLRAAQIVLIGAALITGCNREGGPAPEVPALYAGNGGSGGRNDAGGGAGGLSGEGGDAGADTGGIGGMMAGGAGGAGGVAGVGGTGGGGTGGVGGTPASDSCTDSDATSLEAAFQSGGVDPSQLLTRGTTTGTNGTFHDACDGGDLREHICEQHFTCTGESGQSEGTCAPSLQLTGMVVEVSTQCFGLCTEGVCYVPCPEADDPLRVRAVEGASVELQASAAIRFTCTRELCLAPPPSVDDELTVVSAPVPNEMQLDCRLSFGSAFEPLTLSDGCSYTNCSPVQVIEP